ncbi:MAG: methyltransferase domain-containing protein [Pyrinomonadaceae bacterium]
MVAGVVDQSAGRAPAPLGHMAVHDTVMAVCEALPRGSLLDVPAGEGALAARLLAIGFEVRCCDLYPDIFRLPGVEIKQGDLSASLPYADDEFQYITCLEGLEHIQNPSQAIREFKRLLKPGGHIVISVPNVLNIEERFKWLIYGYTSHFKPLSREHVANLRRDYGAMEEIALHVHPIAYSELRYYLEEHGFRIVRVLRDKPKSHIWLYYPVTALIRLIGRLTPAGKRRERWVDELNSDEVLLGGNTLIVHARKK